MIFRDQPTAVLDPEVVPKAKCRKFSAEYKLHALDEFDNCTEPGQISAPCWPPEQRTERRLRQFIEQTR